MRLFVGVLCSFIIAACGMLELDEDAKQAISDQVSEWGYDPNGTDDHTLSGQGSALGGASLMIPAGSLDEAANISLEEGASLVDGGVAGDVGLSDTNALSSAGAAVMFTSSVAQDATAPMALQIPYTAGGGLAGTYLVVLFKVQKKSEDGAFFSGVIPESEFTTADGKINLETRYFGAFQAAYATEAITERKEAISTAPPVAKHASTSNPELGTWRAACEPDGSSSEEGSRAGSVVETFTIGRGSVTINMSHFVTGDCSGKVGSEEVMSGTWTMGKDSAAEKGAKEVDMAFTTRVMRPMDQNTAKDWSNIPPPECDFKNWEAGKAQKCPWDGMKVLGLVRIEGDQMYLQVDDEKRPQSTTEPQGGEGSHMFALKRQK